MTESYIERCLMLSPGTIARDKGNDIILDHILKIIDIYPWMLDIAKNGFQIPDDIGNKK